MAILDSIKEAQRRGASISSILNSIKKQNPKLAKTIEEATRRGASENTILNKIVNSNQPASPLARVGPTMARAEAAKKPKEATFGVPMSALGQKQPERQRGTGLAEKFMTGIKESPVRKIAGKVGQFATEVVAPLAVRAGESIALPFAQREEEKLRIQQSHLMDLVIPKLRDTDTPLSTKKRLMEYARELDPNIISKVPELQAALDTTKLQVFGEALVTGANILTFGGLGKDIATGTGRVAFRAGRGAITATGAALGRGVTEKGELTKAGITGASISTALALASEGMSALRQSGMTQFLRGRTAARGVGVTPSTVQKDFYYGAPSPEFGDKVVEQGYRGTSKQVIKQATEKQNFFGRKIGSFLKSFTENNPKVSIAKSDIVDSDDIVDFVESNPQSSKMISRFFAKIPDKMNLEKANQLKIDFSHEVPESYWTKINTPDHTKGAFLKTLSSQLRQAINTATGDDTLKTLNNDWAYAKTTRDLASSLSAESYADGSITNMFNQIYEGTLGSIRKKGRGNSACFQ